MEYADMKYLEGKTLAEKQMHYYNGHKCPYCDGLTELVESKDVYISGIDYGLMYICRPCGAQVGCHQGTDQALGPLAKKTLRDLRHEAHKYFDPMCNKKMEQGFSRKASRKAGYKWLQKILGVQPEEAHIGFCGIEQCKLVIAECKKYISGTEENKKMKEDYTPTRTAEVNLMLIDGMVFDYNYDLRAISNTYYVLTHRQNKQAFRFNIDTEFGKWERPGEVWKKIPDIEKFIKKHFKIEK
jgi:hypothetical protein